MEHNLEIEGIPSKEILTTLDKLLSPWKKLAFVLGIACSLYYMWVALVGIRYPQLDRSLFIFFGIALTLCLKPIGQNVFIRCADAALLAAACFATYHFNVRYSDFLEMIGAPISPTDTVCAWLLVVACLEACRRVLGWSIPILAVCFLLFLRYGSYVPQPLTHMDFEWSSIASYLYAGTDGLYSDLTYVLASQMFLFLVFGTFLMRAGAADYFARTSVALFGTRVGGTAKASVFSSAIIGSITGSAAANAAIVGTVTIPLMKSAGFKAHVAGGIEAAASTGGTILPPVMGVAAFIMVALTGIPYSTVATYSILPAFFFFLCMYSQVHFYARRNGLSGTPRSELPPRRATILSGWYYVAPVAVIVTMVFLHFSLAFTALCAIGSAFVASWVRSSSRMGWRATLETLAQGSEHALPIMVVAGPVAIMSECLLLPGTGLRVTGMIIDLAHGNLAITLLLVYIIAYVLGMGLSVVPAYIILATLAAPALIQLHVPVLAAHLLVIWWSQASNIKPPVALAVYVTSSIAKSGLWETGWAAVLKAAGLFFIPVLFVYQPAIFFNGSPLSIAITFATISIGIIACAGAIEGFLFYRLTATARVSLGLGGAILCLGYNWLSLGLGTAIAAATLLIPSEWLRATTAVSNPAVEGKAQ
jgi:TRAP transporter 4TM/12TM fusion protein